MIRCSLCGNEIQRTADSYRRVVGWERKVHTPTRKGGSDILLREALDEFACTTCITRLRSGLNVAQESLV